MGSLPDTIITVVISGCAWEIAQTARFARKAAAAAAPAMQDVAHKGLGRDAASLRPARGRTLLSTMPAAIMTGAPRGPALLRTVILADGDPGTIGAEWWWLVSPASRQVPAGSPHIARQRALSTHARPETCAGSNAGIHRVGFSFSGKSWPTWLVITLATLRVCLHAGRARAPRVLVFVCR